MNFGKIISGLMLGILLLVLVSSLGSCSLGWVGDLLINVPAMARYLVKGDEQVMAVIPRPTPTAVIRPTPTATSEETSSDSVAASPIEEKETPSGFVQLVVVFCHAGPFFEGIILGVKPRQKKTSKKSDIALGVSALLLVGVPEVLFLLQGNGLAVLILFGFGYLFTRVVEGRVEKKKEETEEEEEEGAEEAAEEEEED